MRRLRAGALVAALLAAPVLAQQQEPFEPENYRADNYRAPVPATLAGARVLTTVEAEAIWRARSGAFIDVLPRPPKPKNLPEGTVWRDAPRKNIPGSIWLPACCVMRQKRLVSSERFGLPAKAAHSPITKNGIDAKA